MALMVILWLAATAYNLDKPHHIDDTSYLETAKWISQHPLSPMSGLVNWRDDPEPIHFMNQPPLYSYLLALQMSLFGESETSTHLLQSLFVLICIYGFYSLAELKAKKSAGLLTCFFILGPAFFVGQNLMVDVPLVSLWICFYYALLTPAISSDFRRYLLAGIIASAALLVKYYSLTLIPALFLAIFLKRRYRLLFLGFIPILTLLLWSIFNYIDYGGINILGRPRNPLSSAILFENTIAWTLCLGAITPFSIWFAGRWIESLSPKLRMPARIGILLIFALSVCLPIAFALNIVTEGQANAVLFILFIVNGTWPLVMALSHLGKHATDLKSFRDEDILLFYWLFSGAAFIIFLAPFQATRHILPIMPPLLLILANTFQTQVSRTYAVLSLLLTLSLSLLLGVSDWQCADVYRQSARALAEDKVFRTLGLDVVC